MSLTRPRRQAADRSSMTLVDRRRCRCPSLRFQPPAGRRGSPRLPRNVHSSQTSSATARRRPAIRYRGSGPRMPSDGQAMQPSCAASRGRCSSCSAARVSRSRRSSSFRAPDEDVLARGRRRLASVDEGGRWTKRVSPWAELTWRTSARRDEAIKTSASPRPSDRQITRQGHDFNHLAERPMAQSLRPLLPIDDNRQRPDFTLPVEIIEGGPAVLHLNRRHALAGLAATAMPAGPWPSRRPSRPTCRAGAGRTPGARRCCRRSARRSAARSRSTIGLGARWVANFRAAGKDNLPFSALMLNER